MTFPRPGGEPLIALDEVSVTVPSGRIVALIGANGSGKSTLLRVVAGLLPPDSGTVELDGRAVTRPDPAFGFVFQDARLLPWRDTLSNVAFPLELAGWDDTRRRQRARELMALVGLNGFEAARPHELSGGMQQRAAIARALALEPAVLLMDEPFSALDSLTRERFDRELVELWERSHRTILIVTHSIPEAILLADRVVVLSPRPGRVVAEVAVDLPRPRPPETLDLASFSRAASLVRAALGDPADVPGSEAA